LTPNQGSTVPPTLQTAWDQFHEERASILCPTSLVADYRQVTKWIKKCPITDLEAGRQVMSWVLMQKPVKSSRRVAMYIKSLYRWASSEDIGYLTKNPIASYRMPKPPQTDEEVIVIPRSEVGLLMAALSAKQFKTGAKWDLYAEFMLQTAMRTGEVRAIKWEDIKDDKILIHCNYTLTHGLKLSTKTNKKRTVPLNGRCLQILKELDQNQNYVFPYNRYSFQSYFYDRAKELHNVGLTTHRYRPYDLRHTAISRWIEAGIPVAQVAKWAGNSSEVIWKHYCNVTQEYEMPTL
jgi:integrase